MTMTFKMTEVALLYKFSCTMLSLMIFTYKAISTGFCYKFTISSNINQLSKMSHWLPLQ